MCLATVYKNPENTVVCKNVSRIDVDGEFVLIRDIMGEERRRESLHRPADRRIFYEIAIIRQRDEEII